MKKFFSWQIITIFATAILLGFYNLPGDSQTKLIPFTPEFVTQQKIHLGLDLQGGSQLDYKIDLRKVPEADREDIVNGVREVIEKRVNGLGVSEPNIYTSDIAGEVHIIVEIAENSEITQEDVVTYLDAEKTLEELTADERELVSLEKAKAVVGKTIQLEFKEEKKDLDPQELDKVKENANAALARIKNGEDFGVVGQEEAQAFPGKVEYFTSEYVFADSLPTATKDALLKLSVGGYTKELVEVGGSFKINSSGQAVEDKGLATIKLVDKKEEVKHDKSVATSHILIAYEGSDGGDENVTRSEEEANELAKEIKVKLDAGENFATLAKEHSDDSSNASNGGKLDAPVTGEGTYVYDFEQAALALEKAGDITDIVKTQFGYHIIKADSVDTEVKETKYKFESITFSTLPDEWQETGLNGKHFVRADVQFDQFYQPYVQIQFDDEGAKMFADLTEKNVNRQIAIFVGGELISAPNVNEKIVGGTAQISGNFTPEEARILARDLNTGAIPAPIILTGEYTIGASLGQEALNKSLYAGLLGLALVMVFMLAYYRMAGLVANIALLVYAAILIFLIKSQLHVGLALVASLLTFIFLIGKVLNNQDSGGEKFLSFVFSCVGFFFLTFLLKTGVVLTLAGVAGLILSIGMAVDANILIFERFKEELRNGKNYDAALESGFHRAWSAIRDSNFSTLLTCAILFYFGSSIIRGFAFNLAAGIFVSMFTAIIVTRTLLKGFSGTKVAENLAYFGVKEKKARNINFIKKSKAWLSISGVMVAISLVAIATFGLNLGIDFKGGTLLEFQFEESVTKEQLAQALQEAEKELKAAPESPATEAAESSEDQETLSAAPTTPVDLSTAQIIPSDENSFIIKTRYLTSQTHDELVSILNEKLPKFTEPRFTTIGPVIGQTLLGKALTAILVALAMIIVYIGFAFRRVPKSVNPWRFGVTAIIALAHDVIIVMGVFAIIGRFLNVEIDSLFITAMLTVFGYSVNDTIVIFDRLRENLISQAKDESLTDVTNKSLNQTLARSINTSLSTIIALVAVLIWGSPNIFYFILALTLGTLVGTYSSIFTASPILVMWNKRK